MVPIAALVALGQAGYQYAQARKQDRLADSLKHSNYVPPSVEEAVSNTRREANATSGPYMKRGLEKLRTSTADTVARAKRVGGSAGQVQQAIADADQREKELIKDLEVSDAAYRGQKRQELNQNLRLKGNYESMSRDAHNAAKSALRGASSQNKYNAVSNLAEGLIYSAPDSAFEGKTGNTSAPNPLTDPQAAEAYKRGMSQYGVSQWSGRYPTVAITNPFDYQKYLRDMRVKQFQTGY
ncbi:MAG TPA: hypothetical protein VGD31_07915 [Sphingobacteriaceae bacterium]